MPPEEYADFLKRLGSDRRITNAGRGLCAPA